MTRCSIWQPHTHAQLSKKYRQFAVIELRRLNPSPHVRWKYDQTIKQKKKSFMYVSGAQSVKHSSFVALHCASTRMLKVCQCRYEDVEAGQYGVSVVYRTFA